MRFSRGFWILVSLMVIVLPATAGAQRTGDSSLIAQMAAARAILRPGDRGPAVAELQQMLQDAGFDTGPLDGIYGPITEGAVRALQARYGLAVDGLAGPMTLRQLQEMAANPSGPAAAAETATGDTARVSARPPKAAADPGGSRPVALRSWSQAPAAAPAPSPRTADAGVTTEAGLAASAAPATPAAGPRLVALTFNGDPDPDLLPKILAALKKYGMQATFFVHGDVAEKSPAVLRRMLAEGHEVESAGYASEDLTRLTPAEMATLLQRSAQAIANAVGTSPAFFRPQDGRFNTSLARTAQAQNLKIVLWTNVAVADVPGVDPQDLARQMADTASSGAILMLHQDRTGSADGLDGLLRTLRSRGYQSVTLRRLLAP